ncbi:hypothetical protein UU5_14158 [Rhodanobacter sp. 115]|nr:hypothetical protein UU5_14158 [Rhodanobacter sp. 115]
MGGAFGKRFGHCIMASQVLEVGFDLLALAGRQARQLLQPAVQFAATHRWLLRPNPSDLPQPCPQAHSQPETSLLNANSALLFLPPTRSHSV